MPTEDTNDERLPELICHEYKQRIRRVEGGRHKPNLLTKEECESQIIALSGKFLNKEVYIAIDALDECDENIREELLESLKKIMRCDHSKIKVVISSRDDDPVSRIVREGGFLELDILEESTAQDIWTLVHTEVPKLNNTRGFDQPLRDKVTKALCRNAHGM